jgi:hypothetical protein
MHTSRLMKSARVAPTLPRVRPAILADLSRDYLLAGQLVALNHGFKRRCMDCRGRNYTGLAICEECRARYNELPREVVREA